MNSQAQNSFIQRSSSVTFFILCVVTGLMVGTCLFFAIGLVAEMLGASPEALTLLVLVSFLAGFAGSIVWLKRARKYHQPRTIDEFTALRSLAQIAAKAANSTPNQPSVEAETIGQPQTSPIQSVPPVLRPRISKLTLVLAVVMGIAAFTYTLVTSPSDGRLSSGALPACASGTSEKMLMDMITDAPQSKVLNLKVFAVKEAQEISWDEANQIRRCTARIYSNAGADVVAYKIYWIDRKKGEYYYETE